MLHLRYGRHNYGSIRIQQQIIRNLQQRFSGSSVTSRNRTAQSRITKKNTLVAKRKKGPSGIAKRPVSADEQSDVEIPKTTGLVVGLALVSTMLITAYGQYRAEQPDNLRNEEQQEKGKKVNAWVRNFTLSPESAWYTPLTTLFANDSFTDTLVNGYFLVYAIRGTASILSPTAACLIFMTGGTWTGNPMVVRQLRNLGKDDESITVDDANNNNNITTGDVWWQTGGEGATTAVLGFLCAVIPNLRIPILGIKQLGIPLWTIAAGYIVSDSTRIVWASHEQSQNQQNQQKDDNVPSPLGIYGLVAGAVVWFGLVRWTSVGRRVTSEKRLIRQLLERNFGWNLRLTRKTASQ